MRAGRRGLEVLIPILDLKGISTGDFEGALPVILFDDRPLALLP
jgi:hypothetical protein